MAFKTLCPGQALLTCLTSLTWVWNQWQICVCIFVCERLAMASTRKAYMLGKEWLILLLIIAVAVAARSSAADKNETTAPAVAQDDFCPEVQYVYPYWSRCDWPLRHFQAFHLVSGQLGGLQTVEGMNLVSFGTGNQGSTFYAVPIGTRDSLLGVPVNTEVVLVEWPEARDHWQCKWKVLESISALSIRALPPTFLFPSVSTTLHLLLSSSISILITALQDPPLPHFCTAYHSPKLL